MRKSLGTLALIVLVIGAVGLHRNWFALQREREGTTTEVRLRIDRSKIRTDTRQAAEFARELGSNVEIRVKEQEQQNEEASHEAISEGSDQVMEQWR